MPFDLIRDKGREGRRGYTLPKPDVEMKELGDRPAESGAAQGEATPRGGGRADRDPSLHQPLAPERGHRHDFLPPWLLHDEAQPARQRGRRGRSRVSPDCTRSSRKRRCRARSASCTSYRVS